MAFQAFDNEKVNIVADDSIDYSRMWVRMFLILALLFIIAFIFIDKMTIPEEVFPTYLKNRLGFQVFPILVGIFLTFLPDYKKIYQPTLLFISTTISLSNIYVIVAIWKMSQFAFAYEGLMLYLYFYFFIARMDFRYAVIHAFVVNLTFMLALYQLPVYADKNIVYAGFVLIAYLIGLVGVYKLQSVLLEKYYYNQMLFKLGITDKLTGLLNRKGYDEKAKLQLSICKRNQINLTVFIIDIDHFKEFNDANGHAEGDKVLSIQAEILNKVFMRDSDIICRYGGDEFLVLVAESNLSQCQQLAHKVLQEWEQKNILINHDNESAILSCSIGSFTKVPDESDTLDSYFLVADKALYQAKEQGRAQVISTAGNTFSEAKKA